jgi:hypothetical protein
MNIRIIEFTVIFLILSKLINLNLLASDQIPSEDYFLRMLKEDDIEKKLMGSDVLKNCISNHKSISDLEKRIDKLLNA